MALLQQSAGTGSAVNSHPNPFFLNVSGEMNLKHAAELIIQRLEEYEAALAIRVAKLAREIDAFLEAHVKVRAKK